MNVRTYEETLQKERIYEQVSQWTQDVHIYVLDLVWGLLVLRLKEEGGSRESVLRICLV